MQSQLSRGRDRLPPGTARRPKTAGGASSNPQHLEESRQVEAASCGTLSLRLLTRPAARDEQAVDTTETSPPPPAEQIGQARAG